MPGFSCAGLGSGDKAEGGLTRASDRRATSKGTMTEALLAGTRVVDLAGEPAAMTGRILADLGADVVMVEPPEGHPLRALPPRFLAWGAGKQSLVVDGPDDPRLDELLATADAVVDTPGFPGAFELDPGRAPGA